MHGSTPSFTNFYTLNTVSQPTIIRADIGTAESPQFTISYGPFSEALGAVSTYQIVVIRSGENIDTSTLASSSLQPQNMTLNK